MITQISNYAKNQLSDLALSLAKEAFTGLEHSDRRIVRRVIKVAQRCFQKPGESFYKAFDVPSERQAAYRLIENKSLQPDTISKTISDSTIRKIVREKHDVVIIAQDTSTISKNPKHKIEGIGPIGKKRNSSGFLFHSALGISESGSPLGLLYLENWSRPKDDNKPKVNHQKLPIEEKESFKWLKPLRNVMPKMPENVRSIWVSDRESDIHEYLEELVNVWKVSFVLRFIWDRSTIGEGKKVLKDLENSGILGEIKLEIPSKNGKSKREITAQVWAEQVTLNPRNDKFACYKNRKPLIVNAVVVKEICSSPGEDPVEWRLYTNLPIKTLEEVVKVVKYYTFRWRIEEFHMVLKTGMRAERNELRTAANIQRQMLITAPMAVKLLELLYFDRKNPDIKLEKVFTKDEIKAIEAMNLMTGKEKKIENLGQAIKLLAWHGGWMGRKGDGPPGVRTLWQGYRKMVTIAQAIRFLKKRQPLKNDLNKRSQGEFVT